MYSTLKIAIIRLIAVALVLAAAGSAPVAAVRNAPERFAQLSNLHVNALAQDTLGYLWVGTANGLCRHDGNGYDVYFSDADDPATIPSNNVTGLYYSDGTLWIATARGVAAKEDASSLFRRYTMSADGPLEGYYHGFIEYNGTLYAYGNHGIFAIDHNSHQLRPALVFDRGDVDAAAIDHNGDLWGASANELLGIDSTMHITRRIPMPGTDNATSMFADHAGRRLLIGTPEGMITFYPDSSTFDASPAPGFVGTDAINTFTISPFGDPNSRLLVGTQHFGPFILDISRPQPRIVEPVMPVSSITSSDITTAFIDNADNLWLGTFDKGIFLFPHSQPVFNADKPLTDAYAGQFVTRITGERNGRLWVGTRYNGLSSYDPATKRRTPITETNAPWLRNFTNRFIQALTIDSRNRIWAGIDKGLAISPIGPDGSLKNATVVPHLGNVVTINEDSRGYMWVGTSDNGLHLFSPDLREIPTGLFPGANITRIIPFDADHVLVSSYLDNIYLVDVNSLTATVLHPEPYGGLDTTIDILRASNGTLWMATYGNGLISLDPTTKRLKHYHDFKSNDILSVREDRNGNIWATSSYGLYRIDPVTDAVTSYLSRPGIVGDQYHEKSAYTAPDGVIYFGGNNGLQQITPENMMAHPQQVPVYLTELTTLNRDTDETWQAEGTDLAFLRSIDLDYDNNALSIGFGGISYGSPVEYSYMLEGFDKVWINSGTYSHAIYSNLPPGNYRFLVKTKTDLGWSETHQLLEVHVDTPPWRHPLAIVAYILLGILGVLLLTKLVTHLQLEKERLALAEKKVEDERQLTQTKINFFNNISHELRTPITLIYAPVKHLRNNIKNLSESDVSRSLDTISNNVDRLLALTNQILNFHSVQSESLPLKVERHNPVEQAEKIIRLFSMYAAEKNLSIALQADSQNFSAVYDYDKFEKILSNLLINATKYTPANGHITVRLAITDHPECIEHPRGLYLEMQVIDDGVGIGSAESADLFSRFRRLANRFSGRKNSGFGIGLNYVRELVGKHHGAIRARANAIKGTTFIVDLPADEAAYAYAEMVTQTPDPDAVPDTKASQADAPAPAEPADIPDGIDPDGIDPDGEPAPERHTILVVEDKPDMAAFIASVLSDTYDVEVAENGSTGLQLAIDTVPDLIVSDIMMPLMNGYELLSRVKNNPETSHIPVILLTAKGSDDDKVAGYSQGADIYMEKPFNPQVLKAAVNSIMAKLDRQKQRVAAAAGTENPVEDEMAPLDRQFLDKLYAYINENIANTELNVNLLGRELGFSRTNFYRKIKALTGVTPNDLLRMCRLNKAAQLLRTRRYTIGEISDLTGFGTQSHFSNLFKKQFGMTPREYITAPLDE